MRPGRGGTGGRPGPLAGLTRVVPGAVTPRPRSTAGDSRPGPGVQGNFRTAVIGTVPPRSGQYRIVIFTSSPLAEKSRWLAITVVYTAPSSSFSRITTAFAPAASDTTFPVDSKFP